MVDYIYKFENIITGKKMALRSFFLKYLLKSCDKSVRFAKIGSLISPQCISVGANTYIGAYSDIAAWPKHKTQKEDPEIIIGTNCSIGAYNHITCTNKIIIGDGFLSGKWVTITDNNHGNTSKENLLLRPSKRPITSKGPVIIGRNVWIGDKSTILSGITIGESAVIGANSVVTKDVPPYAVVAGNPAKVINLTQMPL